VGESGEPCRQRASRWAAAVEDLEHAEEAAGMAWLGSQSRDREDAGLPVAHQPQHHRLLAVVNAFVPDAELERQHAQVTRGRNRDAQLDRLQRCRAGIRRGDEDQHQHADREQRAHEAADRGYAGNLADCPAPGPNSGR
jgi:hypothetical protein